jgi:hypothetical protein
VNQVWVKGKDWGVLGGCTASRHVDEPLLDMLDVAHQLLQAVLGKPTRVTWWTGPLGHQWRVADVDGQEIARSVTYRDRQEAYASVHATALQLAQHAAAPPVAVLQ